MKRITAVVCLISVIGVSVLSAHAPVNISLSFDGESKILTVEFIHKVRNRSDHFIDRVRVSLNGEEIVEQRLSLQETKDGGTLIYKLIDAAEGDEIEVLLDCVKGGKLKKKMTLEKRTG